MDNIGETEKYCESCDKHFCGEHLKVRFTDLPVTIPFISAAASHNLPYFIELSDFCIYNNRESGVENQSPVLQDGIILSLGLVLRVIKNAIHIKPVPTCG